MIHDPAQQSHRLGRGRSTAALLAASSLLVAAAMLPVGCGGSSDEDGAAQNMQAPAEPGSSAGGAAPSTAPASATATDDPQPPPTASGPTTNPATSAAATNQQPSPAPQTITSANGTWIVRWTGPTDPLPLNEPFALTATVLDAATGDAAGEDIDLHVDARMPHHRHGMNQVPRIERRSNGTFVIDGMLLHMPGVWELSFDVIKGEGLERAQVDQLIE